MASEEAIAMAVCAYVTASDDERLSTHDAMGRALDAAAAVDGNPVDVRTVTAYESGFEAGKVETGDAQWNAAIEAAEELLRTAGGLCRSSAYVACADAIRSLKRLK